MSMSGMPGMAIESDWPRAASQRFMNLISSDWERLMRGAEHADVWIVAGVRGDQRGHLDGLLHGA